MASAAPRKERRASRITIACNPCRSRKQKCSGERPICEQCLEYHRQCAWPEQLKRGPAKGYIEALETRLYETENVLLKLLSHLSQSQLSAMLSENEPATKSRDQNGFGSLSRQHEVENWKLNPLNSVGNIRKWELESLDNPNKPEKDNNDADNTTTSTRRPRRTRSTTTRHDGAIGTNKNAPECHLYDDRPQEEQTGHSRRYSETEEYGQDRETPPQIIATASPFDASSIPDNFGPVYHTKKHTNTTITPRLSAWDEAPSISFQKQFLW